MTKDQVLVTLLAGQVIAVIRIKNPERLTGAVAALRKGGITAIEITMSVPGAVGGLVQIVTAKTHITGTNEKIPVLMVEYAKKDAGAGESGGPWPRAHRR